MNQPFNEVKASSIAGVVLDCDLATGAKIGGGTATDNTAALNAFLAGASATNPLKLILDGPSLVTGLVIAVAGHTTIEGIGWDSGIWIASGSNADPINNGKILPFDQDTTPPASGENVCLRNFMINGNRGDGTTGNSTSGDPRGVSGTYWYCNINLANLNGVRIEDMYLYDSAAYEIRLNNCSDAVVQNNTIINPNVTDTFNQDGVHIDGPASAIRIKGNYIDNNGSDDAIALNAFEGYGGLIDDAVVSNNTIFNCLNAFRVYGNVEGQVGKVVIADNAGSTTTSVFILGSTTVPNTGDLVRKLIASNNVFSTAGNYVQLQGGLGDIEFSNCTWLSPTGAGSFLLCNFAATISAITLNNCRISRTTAGNNTGTPLLSATAALTLERMTINGFYVVNEQSESYAAITAALAMTNIGIAELYIAALDPANIAKLADSYAAITSMRGAGVFPSSQVAAKSANYTLLPTDGMIVTTGTFSVTLSTQAYAGQRHTFKKSDGTTVLTIVGTIDGAANPTLITQYSKMTIEYDGTNWWTV
ncbi:MAG TPA: hypothetical protein VGF75_03030 [Candidatus Saccharimonadales bacterium]|jgi:hypothetical protein